MKPRQVAVADVGGTHARFALATIENGSVVALSDPVNLKTAEHGSFQLAWQEFGRREGIELPKELALSFAGPVGGDVLKLTNNPWVIRPALMKERLGVDRYVVVNDFGAVAGDMALAQGANAVVIAGGVGLRLADYLPRSGFRDRFIAKGRFERRMDEMPVKLITHPQPGLFGAAAAFAREYG